jgi:hypothetical protein
VLQQRMRAIKRTGHNSAGEHFGAQAIEVLQFASTRHAEHATSSQIP